MNSVHTHPIIVVIATSMARTNLLLERSLKSVYEQIAINPHQIYIVDDNPINKGEKFSEEYSKIKKVIRKLRVEILKPKFEEYKKENNILSLKFDNFFHTTLIPNERTRGFSGTGAWNSAAFKALQYEGRNYFLAFLDDDDEWEPSYLKILFDKTKQIKKIKYNGKIKNAKPVAIISGINRIEKDKTIKILATKETFNEKQFFIKNPGLQGSNLFIDLKTFWTIGGFDESLKSTTDRDLAIRLIEYVNNRPSKCISFVNQFLVNHYAISNNRVTSIVENKKQGLDTFYRKYLYRFPSDIRKKSLDRARKLFGYEIKTNNLVNNISKNENYKTINETKKISLIIGTISNNSQNIKELLKTFLNLYGKYGKLIIDYRFIILNNSNDEYELKPIVEYFRNHKKINVELYQNINKDKSIAKSRTELQKIIYKKCKELYNNDCVSWIIDDDTLFECFISSAKTTIPNYFRIISENTTKNIDALFGLVSDAAPLPFLNTLRTQLIDFYYNLTYFANCNPQEGFKLNVLQSNNNEYEEFYYDLSSKNFQHLEYPYYLNYKSENNFEAFKMFLKATTLLDNGVNVFRKLIYPKEKIGEILGTSIHRGGNTIIYNPELLKVENYTPDKDYNRRSDFNWAVINKNIFNRNLQEIILPLKHDRNLQKMSLITNENKLIADIKGLIFYRFLNYFLEKSDWENKTDYKSELLFFEKVKKRTLRKIKVNNLRTQSLIYLILNQLKNKKYWWYSNEYRKDLNYYLQKNVYVLEVLRIELGKRKIQAIINELDNKIKITNEFISNLKNDLEMIKKRQHI